MYGGTAGQHVRPVLPPGLRHLRNNSELQVLDLNSDAIAAATLTYAMDASSVTGP